MDACSRPLVGFLAVCWFVLIHQGVAAATSQAFDNPELLLLVLGLTVASAAFHEIGHAAACRYGGGRPGGMGAGIYIVWPAFYTDVTDAYRLPRVARLRTDLGGIYFNAVIAVITLGLWLATGVDALLLLIALQMLEIVKNLSPMIRSDGYHILSDATGVPDLYAHMGPTLKRLLPWKKKRAVRAEGLGPRLRDRVGADHRPDPALDGVQRHPAVPEDGRLGVGERLPPRLGDSRPGRRRRRPRAARLDRAPGRARAPGGRRDAARQAHGLLDGPQGVGVERRAAAAPGASCSPARPASSRCSPGPGGRPASTGPCARPTTARWWAPSGPSSAPAAVARPSGVAAPPRLSPGRHLAVALIPRGGPTEEHPALYVVNGGDDGDKPTILVSPDAPDARKAPTLDDPAPAPAPARQPEPSRRRRSGTPPARPRRPDAPSTPRPATQLPFKLPDAPGEGDSQALATNTTDGGIVYDIAYSLVTVSGGEPVDNENSAYALASCDACTTLAVSFQLVLVVGQSDRIMPINVAEALNLDCPSCITTAIAKQIVVSVTSAPSEELLRRLTAELEKLDAIDTNDSPAEVLAQVNAVNDAIQRELDDSGITYPKATPTPAPAETPDAAASPDASATPGSAASPTPTPTPTPTDRGADGDRDPGTDADADADADGPDAVADRHAGRDAVMHRGAARVRGFPALLDLSG